MYDVAIIGGGPAAIFAAYEFVLKYPQLKVIMLEAGNTIEKRFCRWQPRRLTTALTATPAALCEALAVPVLFRTANIILRRNSAAG